MSARDRDHSEGFNAAIAAVLRGERGAAGVTIAELSERSGIPAVTLQRLLAARRAITVETLDILCSALGVSVIDVVVGAVARSNRADPELVERVLRGMRQETPDTPVTQRA